MKINSQIVAQVQLRLHNAGVTVSGEVVEPIVLGCRSDGDVLRRALCLGIISGLASGLDLESCQSDVAKLGLDSSLTSQERAVLSDGGADSFLADELAWQIEASRALLWMVSLVQSLPPRDEEYDPTFLSPLLGSSIDSVLSRCVRRPEGNLLEEATFYASYRAIYLAQLAEHLAPGCEPQLGTLGFQAVNQRAKAFSWLLNADSEWA